MFGTKTMKTSSVFSLVTNNENQNYCYFVINTFQLKTSLEASEWSSEKMTELGDAIAGLQSPGRHPPPTTCVNLGGYSVSSWVKINNDSPYFTELCK